MRTKILIIDDNEGDCQLMRGNLNEAGFELEFITAGSGEEGLEKARTEQPNIVLVDTNLPGIDGYETCRRLKQLDEDIKVIILTGVVDAVDASKAREAGADEFSVKTSDFEDFIEAFKDMVV